MRNYANGGKLPAKPSSADIDAAFAKMGKTADEDRKIDCGGCGYGSCEKFAEAVAAGRNIPSGCVRCSSGSVPAAAAAKDNSKAIAIAEKVSGFATNLLADIENIYASLYSIDTSNQKSASMSEIVVDILSKVVGFCSSAESIDEENLPLLVSTLEKLQTAVSTLNSNVRECASGSSTIREAMQAVADATTELNNMASDMTAALAGK